MIGEPYHTGEGIIDFMRYPGSHLADRSHAAG
jgi:hypothetical protein